MNDVFTPKRLWAKAEKLFHCWPGCFLPFPERSLSSGPRAFSTIRRSGLQETSHESLSVVGQAYDWGLYLQHESRYYLLFYIRLVLFCTVLSTSQQITCYFITVVLRMRTSTSGDATGSSAACQHFSWHNMFSLYCGYHLMLQSVILQSSTLVYLTLVLFSSTLFCYHYLSPWDRRDHLLHHLTLSARVLPWRLRQVH